MAIEELQNGRYHHVRLLGSGGMGEVHLMRDKRVGRQVAIKILRAESTSYVDDEKAGEAARLFQREARAIAALDHPNILPLYDFGEEVVEGVVMTYMVMPYCADGSLEGWLRRRGGQLLAPEKVAALIVQAAEALQHAHEQKMIHLDVKPSNFLLRGNRKDRDRPTLLLADFGIARNFSTVSSSSRTIRGTPVSMAPEQWSGNPVFASDQYALAVMTYEMLVGRPPFTGSMEQLMYKHFTAPAPALTKFNAGLPTELDEVLLRALAKKPEERYPTIVDFASALAEAASHFVEQPEPVSASSIAEYSTLVASREGAETIIEPAAEEAAESGPDLMDGMDGEEAITSVPVGARQAEMKPVSGEDKVSERDGAVLVDVAVEQAEGPQAKPLAGLENASSAAQASETPPLSLPAMSEPVSEPVAREAARSSVPAHEQPTIATIAPVAQITGAPLPLPTRLAGRRLGLIAFLSLLVVVVLVGGSIVLFANRQPANSAQSNNLPAASTHTARATLTPTASSITPTPSVGPGEYVAGTYNGTMQDPATGTQTLSVELTQTQGSGALSGSVEFNSSPQQTYALTGSIDAQGNFHFTVAQPSGLPYYFYGSVQHTGQNEFLRGNLCRTSTNTCPPTSGYFTVGPRY